MLRKSCLVILCIWLSASVPGRTQALNSVASLSSDLLAMLATAHRPVVRVIVRGDVNVIQALAARDGLQVGRVLDGFVVLEGCRGSRWASASG